MNTLKFLHAKNGSVAGTFNFVPPNGSVQMKIHNNPPCEYQWHQHCNLLKIPDSLFIHLYFFHCNVVSVLNQNEKCQFSATVLTSRIIRQKCLLLTSALHNAHILEDFTICKLSLNPSRFRCIKWSWKYSYQTIIQRLPEENWGNSASWSSSTVRVINYKILVRDLAS
jgi:hypothetical protein